jgi:sugar phosphate isomerase/epimerase
VKLAVSNDTSSPETALALFEAAQEAGYDGVQAKPPQYDFCRSDPVRFREHYGELAPMVAAGIVVRLGADPPGWSGTLAPMLEFAEGIGASQLCLTAGARDVERRGEVIARMGRIVNDLGRRARERSVRLSLHNLAGTVLDSVEDFDRLYEIVRPEQCGITFDTGHALRGAMKNVSASLERLIRRVSCVHLKDADAGGRFCSLGTGMAPLEEVFCILEEHGYRGWVVVDESAAEGDLGRSLTAAAKLVRESGYRGD